MKFEPNQVYTSKIIVINTSEKELKASLIYEIPEGSLPIAKLN